MPSILDRTYAQDVAEGRRSREARAQYHGTKQAQTVERLCRDQARADRSDPFTYSRVKAHLMQGIGRLEDYHVDFVPKPCVTPDGEEYVLPVPVNMKRM